MADLAELKDWVEGIRAAAHNAQKGSFSHLRLVRGPALG